jgi:hypothetical protein
MRVQDERAIRELRKPRVVKPSLARAGVDPLGVELGIYGIGSHLTGMQIGPDTGQTLVVRAPALRAGAMPGRERGRLVEEEQLGVAAGGHERRAPPAPELELARDPAFDAIRAADLTPLVMQAAAVAKDQPSLGSGNQLTDRGNSIL